MYILIVGINATTVMLKFVNECNTHIPDSPSKELFLHLCKQRDHFPKMTISPWTGRNYINFCSEKTTCAWCVRNVTCQKAGSGTRKTIISMWKLSMLTTVSCMDSCLLFNSRSEAVALGKNRQRREIYNRNNTPFYAHPLFY